MGLATSRSYDKGADPFNPVHNFRVCIISAPDRNGPIQEYPMTIIRRTLTTIMLLAGFNAHAAELPPPVQMLVEQGLEIVASFDAPSGLTGYAARVNGRAIVFYVTADNAYLLVGDMVDAEGNNLTREHIETYLPGPDLNALWNELDKGSTWVAEGAEKPKQVVYTFTDPNCPYCHLLWLASSHYHEAGLQVRHLIVATLSESSPGKAAAIFEADNPSQAFDNHQQRFEQGGLESQTEIALDTQAKLQQNRQLMLQLGVSGTPAILYKDSDGNVQLQGGMPPLSELAEIFGLPEQSITDPRLVRP